MADFTGSNAEQHFFKSLAEMGHDEPLDYLQNPRKSSIVRKIWVTTGIAFVVGVSAIYIASPGDLNKKAPETAPDKTPESLALYQQAAERLAPLVHDALIAQDRTPREEWSLNNQILLAHQTLCIRADDAPKNDQVGCLTEVKSEAKNDLGDKGPYTEFNAIAQAGVLKPGCLERLDGSTDVACVALQGPSRPVRVTEYLQPAPVGLVVVFQPSPTH